MRFGPGDRVGRYEIVSALGRGGMGEVYRARDPRLGRDVALKFPAAGDAAAAAHLSLAEARAAAALSHPHLCTLFEVEDHDGEAFIVMELIDGRPLSDVIGGGLPERSVLRYGAQIAGAVAHAHERHILHRDLKSGNVMITADDRAKVLDFGIARRFDGVEVQEATTAAALPGDDALAGTLPYMAPELLRGDAPTPPSDVWSLGVVLHEMATGRRPFTGRTSVDLGSSILNAATPELSAGTSSGLRSIVRRCLEKEPGARYANAGQLTSALEALASAPQAPAASQSRWAMAALAAALIVVAAVGAMVWRRAAPAAGPEAPIRSLAVLPLSNVSGSTADDYFVDGITDALIGEIGQFVSVISRTSAMRYKGSSTPVSQIARDLRVDAVLEGSVVRDGPRVRVTAQLIQAGTELSVWTSTFEREIADLIALQREVARTVAAGLKVRLTPQQEQRLAAAKRADPAAVEAYLKGRYQWYKRTPDSLRASIGLYEEAINRDPGYASAYAGLSAAYVLLGGIAIGAAPSAESLPKARDAATRALQLDPDLADAHAALAYTQLYLWDVTASGLSFQRALSINPNDATTRFWNGARLAAEGRFDEAIAEAARARELDPVSPIITAGESWMNHFARRHARAAELASAALAMEPDFVIGHARLGTAERHLGDVAKSVNALEHALARSPDIPDQLAQLGQTYAQQGNRAAALQTVARLSALAKTRYVPAFDLALVHAALGDGDEAFRWLRSAVDERYGPLVFLDVEPDVDALRSDPRFAAIVAEVKGGPAIR